VSEHLVVHHDHGLWVFHDDEHNLRDADFLALIVRIHNILGIHKFTIEFDCEGKPIDGVVATYDFGAPDTYVE